MMKGESNILIPNPVKIISEGTDRVNLLTLKKNTEYKDISKSIQAAISNDDDIYITQNSFWNYLTN